jgi:hypothetical protein
MDTVEWIKVISSAVSLLAGIFILIMVLLNRRQLNRLQRLREDIYQEYALIRMILETDPYILGRLREAWPQYEHMIRKVDDDE